MARAVTSLIDISIGLCSITTSFDRVRQRLCDDMALLFTLRYFSSAVTERARRFQYARINVIVIFNAIMLSTNYTFYAQSRFGSSKARTTETQTVKVC